MPNFLSGQWQKLLGCLSCVFIRVIGTTTCNCTLMDLEAQNVEKSLSITFGRLPCECTMVIKPLFNHKYYLEVRWRWFDVRSQSSDCLQSYVKVNITQQNITLGRLCNTGIRSGVPYTVYSYDGFATIRYKYTGVDSGQGFKLTYKQKPYSYYFLGQGTACSNTKFAPVVWSDNFFSPQWPKGYPNQKCFYQINASQFPKTRIAFMDINLRGCQRDCSTQDDHIIVKGGNYFHTRPEDMNVIKGPIYADTKSLVFTTTYKYIYVEFNSRSSAQERGFVAGFHMMDKKGKTRGQDPKYKLWHTLLIIGLTLLCIVLLVIISCRLRKKRLLRRVQPQVNEGDTSVMSHLATKTRRNLERCQAVTKVST